MADILTAVFSSLLPPLPALLQRAGRWTLVLAAVLVPVSAAVWGWWRARAGRALHGRPAVRLVPTAGFDPSAEEGARQAAHLAQVSQTSDWLPRRAAGVRIRHHCVDGELACALEGPPCSAALLKLPSFAQVDVVESSAAAVLRPERIHFEGVPPSRVEFGRGLAGDQCREAR